MPDDPACDYTPIFDDRAARVLREQPPAEVVADRAAAGAYVFDDDIRLAVNVALATGRPLLVSGPSGAGKSSLARAVADLTKWSYVEKTITSRLQARDLLYEVDHLKRLQDAQQGRLKGDERPYIVPGPLFWAFSADRARRLLGGTGRGNRVPEGIRPDQRRCVVLLDEVDKADPDVPNDLLIPFGRLAFEVSELGETVACAPDAVPLVILTTNGERDLPPAFLRRCVELHIKGAEDSQGGRERLFAIAARHGLDFDVETLGKLTAAFFKAPRPERREPNAAEFLDLLRAWQQLELAKDETGKTAEAVLASITLGMQGNSR